MAPENSTAVLESDPNAIASDQAGSQNPGTPPLGHRPTWPKGEGSQPGFPAASDLAHRNTAASETSGVVSSAPFHGGAGIRKSYRSGIMLVLAVLVVIGGLVALMQLTDSSDPAAPNATQLESGLDREFESSRGPAMPDAEAVGTGATSAAEENLPSEVGDGTSPEPEEAVPDASAVTAPLRRARRPGGQRRGGASSTMQTMSGSGGLGIGWDGMMSNPPPMAP